MSQGQPVNWLDGQNAYKGERILLLDRHLLWQYKLWRLDTPSSYVKRDKIWEQGDLIADFPLSNEVISHKLQWLSTD